MSKKTPNQTNLEKLGAQKLATLVMDLVHGSAPLQRRARMELSAAQGLALDQTQARRLGRRISSECSQWLSRDVRPTSIALALIVG